MALSVACLKTVSATFTKVDAILSIVAPDDPSIGDKFSLCYSLRPATTKLVTRRVSSLRIAHVCLIHIQEIIGLCLKGNFFIRCICHLPTAWSHRFLWNRYSLSEIKICAYATLPHTTSLGQLVESGTITARLLSPLR